MEGITTVISHQATPSKSTLGALKIFQLGTALIDRFREALLTSTSTIKSHVMACQGSHVTPLGVLQYMPQIHHGSKDPDLQPWKQTCQVHIAFEPSTFS